MSGISEYARTLAYFMIFSAFIGIIAPSGSFKKYINLILGLMLIALILEPVDNIINGAHDYLDGSYYKLQNMLHAKTFSNDKTLYDKENMDRVLSEYKSALNEKTVEVIKAQTGIDIDSTEIIVNEDYGSDEFANIEGVYVTTHISTNGHKTSVAKKFALGNADTDVNPEDAQIFASEKIKNCLMDFYNLDISNIHITVRDTEVS